MKINETQMAFLALIVIGLLYLYNNPNVVYKNKPVYYPVYQTEYPFNRNLNMNRGFRPDPRGRMPRPHHNRSHINPIPIQPINPPGFIPGVPNPIP